MVWLPVPDQAHVESFRELCSREFGMELDPAETLDAATRLLQIYFLVAYANRYLAPDGLGDGSGIQVVRTERGTEIRQTGWRPRPRKRSAGAPGFDNAAERSV